MQLLIYLLLLFCSASAHEKTIYIYPGYWGDLFDQKSPLYNRDNCLEPMILFKEAAEAAGFEIKQTWTIQGLEDFKYLIVFDIIAPKIPYFGNYPKEKMILFLWEPPSVLPENYDPANHVFFSKIFTWDDTLVDNRTYFKLHYPACHSMITEHVPFKDKKLSCLISSNKLSSHPNELYSERKKTIGYFERFAPHIFDLYGKKWPSSLTTYKGEVERKVDVLAKYKFSFAYENIKEVPGYVTEKIFDCFQAGCVPIYWGASNIEEYIPKGCYIRRDYFPHHKALVYYLNKINEDEYQTYINNIKTFLNSEKAEVFSQQHFINLMMDLIQITYE